jgi:outer membrane protein assembly factor BamD
MILRFILLNVVLVFITNCSSNLDNQTSKINQKDLDSPKILYVQAIQKLDNEQYDEALDIFKNIEKIYPLSNESIQSQIMSGFIDYLRLDYDSAIIKFSKLINKYPTLHNIDYVYYMKAICHYEQITHEGLDGENNYLALKNLDQVINRFPKSKYAKDSHQKIILVKSNIAAKHMTIGRFYQKNKKYTAALNRYKIIIESFSETKFIPEALYRTSEIYYSLGMIEESSKTAAILGYNYPNSEWYELSYKNLIKKEENSIFISTIDKIFN